ncbi:MAG: hypothetical protein ABH875_01605, partial [Candidatus Omnitrophota bacterium]
MKIFLTALTIFSLGVLVFPNISSASSDPMYDFYEGLAEIIEREMDHPNDCAAASEKYIRSNIGTLKEALNRSKAMAEEVRYEEMTQEELEKKTAEMVNNKGFRAANRFIAAFETFA